MIIFNNWQISSTGVLAQQYDNNTCKLEVVGKLPEGYQWTALVQFGELFDPIALTETESGAEVLLTKEHLSQAGYYSVQLRGHLQSNPNAKRHTNVITVYVPATLNGSGAWPSIPTEFEQFEQRMLDLNAHPPVPGDDGFWHLWNGEAYVQSDLVVPVDPNGYSVYYYSAERYSTAGQHFTLKIANVNLQGKTLRVGDFVITANGSLCEVTSIANVATKGDFVACMRCALRGTLIYFSSESKTEDAASFQVTKVNLGGRMLCTGDFIITANGRLYEVTSDSPTSGAFFSASLLCVLKGDPGNVLTAPNGTQYALSVDNDGNLTTTKLS